MHLVLPPKPTGEISDESLDKISGGAECMFTCFTL